jgi:hypothetical protein
MPEGHRYQEAELGELNNGIARWARKSEVVTIPGAISGVDSLKLAIRNKSARVAYAQAIDPPLSRAEEEAYMLELRQSIQNLHDRTRL